MPVVSDGNRLHLISTSLEKHHNENKTAPPSNYRKREGQSDQKNALLTPRLLFSSGIRTPLIADLQDKYGASCKFDVIDNGQLKNSDLPRQSRVQFVANDSVDLSNNTYRENRENEGLRTPRRAKKVSQSDSKTIRHFDALAKRSKTYVWQSLNGSPRLSHDARDALYFNTYCSGERPLRYRGSSLPQITQNRPWTVGDGNPTRNQKLVLDTADVHSDKHIVTIAPQRPRPGMVKFNQYIRRQSQLSQSSEPFFEVKRLSSNSQNQKDGSHQWPRVHQPINFPQREAPKQRKVERPLKSEHIKSRALQRAQTKPDLTLTALAFKPEREYKSADTYRNYLQFVQTREQTRQSNDSHVPESRQSSDYGFDSKVLQSVIDVNLPNDEGTSEFPDEQSENKSIVVEIKSSWKENGDKISDSGLPEEPGEDVGSGHTCPANTPLPHE